MVILYNKCVKRNLNFAEAYLSGLDQVQVSLKAIKSNHLRPGLITNLKPCSRSAKKAHTPRSELPPHTQVYLYYQSAERNYDDCKTSQLPPFPTPPILHPSVPLSHEHASLAVIPCDDRQGTDGLMFIRPWRSEFGIQFGLIFGFIRPEGVAGIRIKKELVFGFRLNISIVFLVRFKFIQK